MRCRTIMTSPRIRRKKASTITIKISFSVGLTRTSSDQEEEAMQLGEVQEIEDLELGTDTNKIDFGIIGLHTLVCLVPFTNKETVKLSTKLLLLPMPI